MEVPWLFLSHSGAQKEFTRRLYQELLHVGHSAFFDEDARHSLPKGQPFPPRIVQACRGCKIGIVVLSHDYLESLWPMLELEQLTFLNPSSDCILYPLFYRLQPADLSKEENLKRWQATWERHALAWQSKVQAVQTASTSHFQISINIIYWRQALEMLRYQSGDVFHPHMDDHAYIRMVVSNICKRIPPPRARYLLDKHIRGMVRLQQEIDDLFQQALPKSGDSGSAVCLGVWGLGGSGKTTLCKNMANFYRGDFPGRICLLELPTEKDEGQLVKAMKEVLLTLGRVEKDEIEMISSVESIMSRFEEGLKGHQVFLAIDNVWDWTIERAKQIMSMACVVAGSKILVTSRSKQLLQRLLPWRIVPVPSITEEEAVEVLKSLSFFLPDVILPELEDLKGLARLCFFEGQCNPLLLKMMGDTLRHRGGRMIHVQGWKDLISRLQTRTLDDEENTILEVLETSFLALTPKLQKTFIDLVTCTTKYSTSEYRGFIGQCKWLSMIHDGLTEMDMRDQLIELEYHGLLEIKEDEAIWRQISIHDLHKSVARRRADGRDACFFEECLSDLSIDHHKCRNTKYIDSSVYTSRQVGSLMRVLRQCSELEILVLRFNLMSSDLDELQHDQVIRLSVRSMQYLRFLDLDSCIFLQEIEGWEGSPNLVSLKLHGCFFLENLGDIGCLRKLETLVLSRHHKLHLASLGQPPKLNELDLSYNNNLQDVRTVFNFTALRKLNLAGCQNLELMEWIACPLTDMEELDLTRCSQLRIADLTNLARLKVFRAAWCQSLKTVKLGVSAATSLQVLDLLKCSSLAQLRKLPSGSLSKGLELVLCDGGVTSDHGSMSSQLAHQHRPFVNLRELLISGNNSRNTSSLDVSSLMSLELCYLGSFPSLREIQGLSTLVKLSNLQLGDCPLLKEISGLDALPKLKMLIISDCSRLMRILGSGALVSGSTHNASTSNQVLCIKALDLKDSSNAKVQAPVFPMCLEYLSFQRCTSLTTLPPLTAAAALGVLSLCGCSSLTDMSSLTTPLPSLHTLYLEDCHSLRELPNLTHLTSLGFISVERSLNTSAVKFCEKTRIYCKGRRIYPK